MPRYCLFWTYGDKDDTPFIVIDPPADFEALLAAWRELDRQYLAGGHMPAGWDYVNVWLAARGVAIVEPAAEFRL